ncbi:hypothetical protein SASPL_148384 [Salvia splendens]|uniref:FHA domain-containing protein n=1 Tax=Salvia splendens TaxID=180675 RepID=A0A8X8WAQ0_SALSN|nr:hypothetical protein SASPL_148384 [Salvia splendens]
MGAMAPPPTWNPQDDVLLKNSVEAGASLESLAKGAVQFTRHYTVQELKDRWLSLLYDPVVSVEASAHMIEVESYGVINQLRPNKFEGVKNISSGKRKAESIRKHYYAMRKRISVEPSDMVWINVASEPGYSNFREGNELLSKDGKFGNPGSNILAAQGPDYSIRPHPFAKFGPHAAESSRNDLTPSFGGIQNHGQDNLHGKNLSGNLPYPYEENISITGDCSKIPEFAQSSDLPLCNLFEAEDLVNQASACPDFGDQSFPSFGCSPPLPHMPIWQISQDITAAELNIEIPDADLQLRDEFMIPQIANESEALGYGGGPSNLKLKTSLSCDSLIDMTSNTQEYLQELFDLSNDEEHLYMDNDGKEVIEKSYLDGLSSLLLDSPNQCDLSGSGLGEAAVVADGQLVDRIDAHNEAAYNEDLYNQLEVTDAQVSASDSTLKVGPEYRNGVICCTLNTEDPDIPSNDDVFLPFRFPSPTNSSGAHWGLHNPSYLGSPSVKNISSTRIANGGQPAMKSPQKDSYVPSGRMGSFHPSDDGLRGRSDHGVKFELPESSVQHAVLRETRKSDNPNHVSSVQHAALRETRKSDNPNHVSVANVNANNLITGVKGGPTEMGQGKNNGRVSLGSCLIKQESGLDVHQNLQNNSIGGRSGVDCIAEIPTNISSNVDFSFQHTAVPKAISHSLLSDKEELLSENESDVPYFSDVEAMILDMDLSPNGFDLSTNPEGYHDSHIMHNETPAVQRYQHEETKRTIIRLEQAADASRQRAIAGQGTYAVLYGRFSTYFIKKTEVLLGRATDGVKVDIDLGREKNGGKISRRQAMLKMDMKGIFHLKNLGRNPVYMNGKEVAPGQSVALISGCLVEVRGLSFEFKTSHKMIKQYIDSAVRGGV